MPLAGAGDGSLSGALFSKEVFFVGSMRGDSSDSDTTSGDTGGLSLSRPLPVECTKPYLKVESHFFLGILLVKATKKVVKLSTLLVVACGPELNLLQKLKPR